jgi:diguanylate cyclase (GGDEF)-like protein
MQPNFDLYVSLIFFLAAIPYAWIGLYAWRKRPAVAVTPFAWMELSLSVWSLAYALEILSPSLSLKMIALKAEYIGVAALPIFLLFFAFEFTGKSRWLTLRARLLLWALPLLMQLLIWTNEYHRLLWNTAGLFKVNGLVLLKLDYNPLFWVFAIFSFSMTLSAVFLLLAEMIQRPGEYRAQVNLIVLGILAPLAGSLLYILKGDIVSGLDLTPLLALPASLGLAWAITRRYRLLELLPLEYLTVLKNMRDGVIVADPLQRVVYLNPIAETLLECSEAEAIGQPLNYVSNIYGGKLAGYLSGGEQRVELTFGEGSRAKVFEVTVSSVTALNAPKTGGADHMIILHDITHLKETETALSRRESIMSAMSLAAEQFLKESTWEHNIPGVLEKIGQAANLSRIFVAMNYMDDNQVIYSSLCYEWANAGASSQINNPVMRHVPFRKSGMGRWEKTLSQGNPIFGLVKNFPEEERGLLQKIESVSVAVMPVFVNRQWWGFIMFDECRHERQWTDTELQALSIAASMFGSAEARARTEQKLLRRQKSLDLLQEIVLVSLKSEDLLAMSQALVEPFARLIHADGCALSLWDGNSLQEVHLATYDHQQRVTPMLTTSPAEHTFTEVVLNSGHTLVVENADATFYEEQHITEYIPASSVIVLPLAAGKKRLGAVTLWFDHPHRFQSDEVSISEQASNLVALALEKFQTVEQAERRAVTSETLRKASIAIAETLETEKAVERVLEQLKQVVSYDSASVQLLNDHHLEIVGGSGFSEIKDVIGMSFPIPGDNPNTVVMQTGKPYLLPEISEVFQIFKYPPHNHIRSWLGIPLIFQERIIGLLAIDSAKPNCFTEEDIHLANMFANQVAVTLENARIFKETQDQAITDVLTGVYNRRGLFQVGDFEFVRARRTSRPFSMMMFDIDHFKKINDQYGHAAGDQVLRGLAERCRSKSRSVDMVCRYGGEEFVIFLPETNIEATRMIAERLRQTVMDTPFPTDAGELHVTISIGIAQANERDALKTLIERADQALYTAKRTGRNRVVMNSGTQPLSQV